MVEITLGILNLLVSIIGLVLVMVQLFRSTDNRPAITLQNKRAL